MIKVRSAISLDIPYSHDKYTVGITKTIGRSIIFRSADYDNAGTVSGMFQQLSLDDSGFYLAAYDYNPKSLAKCGYTADHQKEIRGEVLKFVKEMEGSEVPEPV